MDAETKAKLIAQRGRVAKVVDVPELEGVDVPMPGSQNTIRLDGTARLMTPTANAMLGYRARVGEKVTPEGLALLFSSAWVDNVGRPRFTEAMATNLLDVISADTAMFLLNEILSLTSGGRAAAGNSVASQSGASPTASPSP